MKWFKRYFEQAKPTDEWKLSVTPEHIEAFRQGHGVKALSAVLSRLGNLQRHYNVLTSELGQVLLGDAIAQCNELLMKIADNQADIDERAEYRAYRRILGKQMAKIAEYRKAATKLRNG